MRHTHPLLAVSLTTFAFVLPSCSTSDPAQKADPAPAVDASTGSAPAPAADDVAQDPQGQGSVAAQRSRFLVEKYLEDADELRRQGQPEAARLQLLKARELAPNNERVEGMLRAVNAELDLPSGDAGSFAQDQIRLQKIHEQRRRSEVMSLLDRGRNALDESNYDDAITQARRALLNIEIGKSIDWGDLEERSRALLRQAEDTRSEAESAQEEALQRELSQRRRAAEAARETRRQARMDDLLRNASRAFERRQFKLSQDLAFQALELDGTNQIARNLHGASIKALRESRNDQYYQDMAKEVRRMLEASEDLKVPQTDILYLDPEIWERAQARTSSTLPTRPVDAGDTDLRAQLAQTTLQGLSFTEDDGTYDEVKTRVQTITNIPIIITPEARETIDGEGLQVVMDITAPVTVANFLNLITAKSENLSWAVRDGVVQITSKAQAGGENFMFMHDVRDLIFAKTEFLPPQIRDIPTGDSDSETPRTGGEGEEKTFFVEIDSLVSNIKDATDLTYWESEGGGIIDQAEAGYLIVTANAEMQERVRQVLEDMRRFATAVVTVESKFLTISQNYLQEIGVDFRGLGGSGAKGDVAQLDDITSGLDDNASRGLDNSGTGDPAANPAAGAFFNDGGDGDVRARTEGFFQDTLGRALSTTGGATAALVYLDDLQLQAIIRAVEKRQDVQELNGQTVTVLNNERGHVAVINQTAYVRDFDVEVAQAAFIADPKVDVVQDGIVLDVKPTIQHDRKRITLDLQPTVAELVRPIPTFSTSLAGTTQPVTLQLPVLNVRSFATTATIPDGGSVLIGGLREVLSVERRAEVPLLGKIPLLSFFFKTEGVADENTSLMVLIRATVTDVNDLISAR